MIADINRNQDEEQLLILLKAGDARAQTKWVKTHHSRLRAIAASIIGDAQAEEVVQEAWISAFRALVQFEARSSLGTWLTRIVINAAKQRLIKQKRLPTCSLDDDSQLPLAERFSDDGKWEEPLQQWSVDNPEAMLDREQLAKCLQIYLGDLPNAQQSALLLRDQNDLSFQDIADILATTQGNVRVLIHRARLHLLSVIDRFEKEGVC